MHKILILLLFLFSSPLHNAVLIQGDPDAAEDQTFSFPIKNTFFSSGGNFYVGSNQTLATQQEFSLSQLARGAHLFRPLNPAIVELNGSKDVQNPLYGTKVIAIGALETEE